MFDLKKNSYQLANLDEAGQQAGMPYRVLGVSDNGRYSILEKTSNNGSPFGQIEGAVVFDKETGQSLFVRSHHPSDNRIAHSGSL
ncbi:MAG: hypothetical protein IPM37_09160 [Hahellaceae bacterium]|nr:hypothetical protein [Hahellaceae bacterium]